MTFSKDKKIEAVLVFYDFQTSRPKPKYLYKFLDSNRKI